MTEKLLQFIWQFGYFNHAALHTTTGEPVSILQRGQYNKDQGPDFLHAQIRIGQATFYGSVELHLATSHWKQHRHDSDRNYRNVVLHVVYQNDLPAPVADIPVLELEQRIPFLLLQQYERLMQSASFIPCEQSIARVPAITWAAWKERLLAERLTRKAEGFISRLQETDGHWEEVFWWMLARNFGAKVNSDAFEAIARSLPIKLLAKHRHSIQQLEALLLGQAGLLNEPFEEAYPQLLQREYQFLCRKYGLKVPQVAVHFLRMRPGNFPTVRMAQLAALVQQSQHLFSKLLEEPDLNHLMEVFSVTANDFWHYHYTLQQPAAFGRKKLGRAMIQNIVINTVAPVLFAYGLYQKEGGYQDKALRWLEALPAEANSIVAGFARLDREAKTAFDSQALIELKNEYCTKKHCLQCAAGNALMKLHARTEA